MRCIGSASFDRHFSAAAAAVAAVAAAILLLLLLLLLYCCRFDTKGGVCFAEFVPGVTDAKSPFGPGNRYSWSDHHDELWCVLCVRGIPLVTVFREGTARMCGNETCGVLVPRTGVCGDGVPPTALAATLSHWIWTQHSLGQHWISCIGTGADVNAILRPCLSSGDAHVAAGSRFLVCRVARTLAGLTWQVL